MKCLCLEKCTANVCSENAACKWIRNWKASQTIEDVAIIRKRTVRVGRKGKKPERRGGTNGIIDA